MPLTTKTIIDKYLPVLTKKIAQGLNRKSLDIKDVFFEIGRELKNGGTIYQRIGEIVDLEKEDIRNWEIGKYRLCYGDTTVSTFELYQMPHCCGICVSTASSVTDKFQKLGIATLLNSLRQDIASLLGYSILLCTDCNKNTAQRRVLEKNGWVDIYSFTNRRTGNKLNISVKPIPKNE